MSPFSVEDKSDISIYDGHINRNIRLAMAMVDLAQPYIMLERILKIKILGVEKL